MMCYVVRIKVYINTVKLSPLDFANVMSLGHSCDQPGERISCGIKYMPKDSSGYISDEEIKALDLLEQFSKENGLNYEIIDLAKAGPMTRLKFALKGWKVPVISIENEITIGLPTKEQLGSLLRKQHVC
jgi:hypothetical protein